MPCANNRSHVTLVHPNLFVTVVCCASLISVQADAQTYLHRCGRTGRYGASGTVINLVDPQEDQHLSKIELFYQMAITDIPAADAAEKLEELGKFE